MSRPMGISILALLALLAALPALAAGLALVGVASLGPAVPVPDGFMYAVGSGTLIYAGLSLVLAYGFWRLRSWAWTVGVVLQVLGIATTASQFLYEDRNIVGVVISLSLNAVILLYLFRPNIKAAFARE